MDNDNEKDSCREMDSIKFISDNYVDYSKYCSKTRSYAGIFDGCKESYRHLIFASRIYDKTLVKAPAVIGEATKISVHGDSSVEGVLLSSGCQYNYFPLFDVQGNWGGKGFPAAASRYLKCKLSEIAKLIYLDFINYADWTIGEAGFSEPIYLPSLLPYCLLSGTTSIPVGMPVPNIPPLNIMGLIDFYIDTLNNVKDKHYPIPDVGDCYIDLDRNSVEDIIRTGKGRIWYKAKMHKEGLDTVVIDSRTPQSSFDKAYNKVSWYVDNDYIDYNDESTSTTNRHVYRITDLSQISQDDLYEKLKKVMANTITYTFIVEEESTAVYCGLDYIVKRSLEYLTKCVLRKLTKDKKKDEHSRDIYLAIEALRNSNKFKDIPKMSDKELLELVMSFGFSEDISKGALNHTISYLTKSHKKELDKILSSIEELSSIIDNPTNYIIGLYQNLKSKLNPIYSSRQHSELLEDSSLYKYAKVSGDTITISSDTSGSIVQNRLMLLSNEGWLRAESINTSIDTKLSMIINNYHYDKLTGDTKKYLVALSSEGVRVVEVSSINYIDKRIYKTKSDSTKLIKFISTNSETVQVTLSDNKSVEVKCSDCITGRLSYPTYVGDNPTDITTKD